MKLTSVLYHVHMGRMFRQNWKVQGRKVIFENGSLNSVKEKGLDYEDAVEFINKRHKPERKPLVNPFPENEFYQSKIITLDESHPDYKEEKCMTYNDNNVLLEGLKQAQALTNTLVLDPKTLLLKTTSADHPSHDKLVRRCLRSSLMFDAWQEKLPIRHDPLREAWRFSRDYGITDRRRNDLLVRRLLQLCSSFSPQLLGQRVVLNSPNFRLPYTLQSGERLLFSIRGDAVIFSQQGLSVKTPDNLSESSIPDLTPLAPTVSLESTNIYQFEPQFPIVDGNKQSKIHTVIVHYNETEVANIFETPVSVDQVLGRSLVHSWVYAMSQSLQNGDKKEPVTIQVVQTDGKFFHFGVLKSTGSDSEPNFFWSFPIMNIFETCKYVDGIPVLEGYNPAVFNTLLAFYNNS